MTKYAEILKKFKKNRAQFKDYEEETRQLISSIRTALIEYLGCPADRIEWLQFSSDEPESSMKEKDVIELSSDRRMSLYEDAFYGIKLRILLYDPNNVVVGGDYLTLSIIIKKKDSEFTIKLGKELINFDSNELQRFVEFVISKIEDLLDNEFHSFLKGGEKQPMGFIMTRN